MRTIQDDDKQSALKVSSPRWRKIGANIYAVKIVQGTTLGDLALSHFLHSIPLGERRKHHKAAYRWIGSETDADGQRWGFIQVTKLR